MIQFFSKDCSYSSVKQMEHSLHQECWHQLICHDFDLMQLKDV